jgi:ATP-binding cassette subfamily B protein
VQSIFDVLDAKPLLVENPNPIVLTGSTPPLIEFNHVDFSYPHSKKKILQDFSLQIYPGEKVAFVGENGAGKSTIIRLLTRFYDVTNGELLLDGKNIKDLDTQAWYKKIGVLFQDFGRYEHSVKENIYFGDVTKPVDGESIHVAATLSGAKEFIQKFDAGYDQMLGKTFEKGEEISTGQWQKIALARAFFRNAPILVLDEPTASIDAKAESEIFERVEKLSKDKTVIIISHRFSTVRNADRIFVIDNGKIIETGNHEKLMKLDGQYAKLFTLQAKGYQ